MNPKASFYAHDEVSGMCGPFDTIDEVRDYWQAGSWPAFGHVAVSVYTSKDGEAMNAHSIIDVEVEP